MPRLTIVTGGELVPATRFRVDPVCFRLERKGWKIKIFYGYGKMDQRIKNAKLRRVYRGLCRVSRAVKTARIGPGDLVLTQRLSLPWVAFPEVRAASRAKGFVFDFDDAVFLDRKGHESALRRRAFNKITQSSSYVVAGNRWLADQIVGQQNVKVVPTCVDTQRYCPDPTMRRRESVHIGWIGTGGNLKYLWQLESALTKLRSHGYDFELTICSDEYDETLFEALGASFVKWSPDAELPFLQSLDIGVMPLADDIWCRGKCSFKLIQYMAVGCAVVGSPVGMNNDVLDNDSGGLKADHGWFTPLSKLISSRETREKLGEKARESAVKRFDISVAAQAYHEIFQEISARDVHVIRGI